MTYRYVIIEDEPIVRRGTELKMTRTGLPLQLIGEADNGVDGLSVIRNLRPDIAIIDMRMPDMDGAIMMRELRKENIDIEFIVASGYSDFEYAREGIRSDACAYLLKPFSDNELQEAIIIAISRIERRASANIQQASQAHLQVNKAHRILASYLMGVPDHTQEPDLCAIGISKHGHFIVAEAVWSQSHNALDCPIESDVIVEIKLSSLPGRSFYVYYSQDYITKFALESLCLQLRSADSAGISAPCTDLDMLYAARRQAQEARRDHAIGLKNTVSMYQPSSMQLSMNDIVEKRMMLALESADADWFHTLTNELACDAARRNLSVNNLICMLRGFFASAIEHLAPHLIADAPSLFQFDYLVQRTANDDDLSSVIADFISSSLRVNSNGSVGDALAHMRAYLDNHYYEDLSLERISQIFGISPGYASQLFNQRMGTSYVNYITALRISHAKELLSATQLDNSVIAARCGFSSVNYFYRVFKRSTGLTPSDYRQRYGDK